MTENTEEIPTEIVWDGTFMRKLTRTIIRSALEGDPEVDHDHIQQALALLDGKTKPGKGVMPLLLTVADTCRILNLSRQTLWRLSQDGTLMPVKVRGATRYRRQDVELFAAAAA